jgi:hypothetical protein
MLPTESQKYSLRKIRIPAPLLAPSGFRGLRCNLPTLFFGHSRHAAFAADLTAFAPDSGHICGEVCWKRRRRQSRRSFGSGPVNDPLGELVGVSRSFSFADGHGRIIAHNANVVELMLHSVVVLKTGECYGRGFGAEVD